MASPKRSPFSIFFHITTTCRRPFYCKPPSIYLSSSLNYLHLFQYTVDIFLFSSHLLLRLLSEKVIRTPLDVKLQWLQKYSSITFSDTVSRYNSKSQHVQ